MTGLARLLDPPVPLPRVPGPKLAPSTRTGHAPIRFIMELGNPEQDMDSRVWVVEIRGKRYALKMFGFASFEFLQVDLGDELMHDLASYQLYFDYYDAFNCECRAYGRLKQENREDLAVRAHGYLLLTPQQEAEVTQLTGGVPYSATDKSRLNGANHWGRLEEHRYLPIRAIVKDIASNHEPFAPTQLPKMWEDLETLHKLGILVRDINVFNYLEGKLVNFSRAWTTPHPWCLALHPDDVRRMRVADPRDLRKAIVELGMEKRWDWDKVIIPDELTKCASGLGKINDRYGVDPRLYNWRKWEKNPAAVDTFFKQELFAKVDDDGKLENNHLSVSG